MNIRSRYRNILLSLTLAQLALAPAPVSATTRASLDAVAEAVCAPNSGSSNLSGQVTGLAGVPLPFISVTAYTVYGQFAGAVTTNASGVYTISNLIGSAYILKFEPYSGPYALEWNGNQTTPLTAPPITVASGVTVTAANAELNIGAKLTGSVLSTGGTPLQFASIRVYDISGREAARGTTNITGTYSTQPGLPAGVYRLQFSSSGGFLTQYSGGAQTLKEAATITITAAATLALPPVTLAQGATITGRVTAADTGLPMVSISISADDSHGTTDASGIYTITGLATGPQNITANPNTFGNSNYVLARRVVTVTAPNAAPNVDFVLIRGGVITGRVTDEAGAGLQNVQIYIANDATNFGDWFQTEAGGYLTATGIPSGKVRMIYAPEAYIETETEVTVTAPLTTPNVNTVLQRGAAISGIVTDEATGMPLPSVYVEALGSGPNARLAGAFTNAAGRYVMTSTLRTGNYKIRFNASSNVTCAYVSEYHANQLVFASGSVISATAPAVYEVNAALARGSLILGKVTDANTGAPVVAGDVTVADPNLEIRPIGRVTFLGGYVFDTALPSGSYKLRYGDNDSGYIDEYYQDRPTVALADSVVLIAPTHASNIDFVVAKGATATGRVRTGDTGLPFTRGYVAIHNTAGKEIATSGIEDDGTYRVASGLPSGVYRIAVIPYTARINPDILLRVQQGGPAEASGYLPTFYNNGAFVNLTAPDNTPNIDIIMQRGAFLPVMGKR